jgi:hypothetical protein
MQKEDEELEFLRSVSRKTLRGARIYGVARSSQRILGNNDKGYKDSLAGVTIKIESERQSLEVKTDGDGKFDVQGLEPGIYRVTAVLPDGYVPVRSIRWSDYSISWDKELSLRDCGCAQLVFELYPSANVDGRVLDAEGRPLSGVEIGLVSEKWREETDNRGRFTIEGLKDYEYKIRVYWRDNESSASEEDKLKFTGDLKDLKIVLSKQ